MATLEAYASAYCKKDIDALMSVFVDSDEISLIGTGEDELCSGREAIRQVFLRNFNDATAQQFEWHWSDIIISGDCAVVSISLCIYIETQGERLNIPIRWTVALKKIGGLWLWLHRHASSAARSQDEGTAYPKE